MNNVKNIVCLLLGMISFLCSCNPDEIQTDIGVTDVDPACGSVIFNFAMPTTKIPAKNLRRVELSLAKSADSLYRKEYCSSANISDYKLSYSFTLLPGRYFYQAGITCTSQGDTCLYGGFPGGQLSVWWIMGFVDIDKGKSFTKNLTFK